MDNLSTAQKIQKLKGLLDYSTSDCEALLTEVRSLLKAIQYKKRPIRYKTGALIRATCNVSEGWFDNVSKFGYPPKKVLIELGRRFGRCNWPNEPIFYCSSETGVPVFEVKPSVGDYIVLSHWFSRTGSGVDFHVIALGAETIANSLQNNDHFAQLLMRDEAFVNSDNEAIKEVDRFIGELFVKDATHNEKIYWLTSTIVKSYLEYMKTSSDKKIDGLIYPSVAGDLSGFNIVLTTEFVDNNLQPKEARMYQVVGHDEDITEYKLRPVKRVKGCYSTGELSWEYVSKDIEDQIWTLSPQSPYILI